MTYETMRAEFRVLLVDVINTSTEFTLKAHLALADSTCIPALQIVNAIICMQEVRAAFAKTYGPFVRFTQQYLKAERDDPSRTLLPETQEVRSLIGVHNKCMRGFQLNEAFFFQELYKRAQQPSAHQSALQDLSTFARTLVSKPKQFEEALRRATEISLHLP